MRAVIVIINRGFGNKIFNLLVGFYICYINKCDKVFINIQKSQHDSEKDPSIFDIFPDVSKFCKLINNEEIDRLWKNYKNVEYLCENTKSINDFEINEPFDIIFVGKKTYFCYQYVYDIFSRLPHEVKEIFIPNKNIISEQVLNLAKQNLAMVHIRYGDKINLSLKHNNKEQFFFLLNTPSFYIEIIQKLLQKGCKVYIVSDDNNIVNHYIINKINNDNVKLLNIPWWESFYLLSNSKYNIISHSSFSIFATMINKNIKKVYVVDKPSNYDTNVSDETKLITKTDWVKINNQKYILNYDRQLMKNMLKYR